MGRHRLLDSLDVPGRSLSLRPFLAVLLVALLVAVPVTAQVTEEDISQAQAEMDSVLAEVQILNAQWEDIVSRRESLTHRIALLRDEFESNGLVLGELEVTAQDRAIELYMTNSLDGIAPFLGGKSVSAVGVGASYVSDIVDSDQEVLGNLAAVRTSLEKQRISLDEAETELEILEMQLEENVVAINEKLEAAQANYLTLKEQKRKEDEARRKAEEEARKKAAEAAAKKAAEEEAARNATSTTQVGVTTTVGSGGNTTTTTTPPPTSGSACPVDGAVSFTDSWGAPRSGGRSHQGVDMLAAKGTPLVAIVSGSIKRMRNSTLGGKTIWLRGSNGHEYYYAHLDSHASGLHVGQSVSAGEYIGTVGTSGNAPAHIPHLHFEYHPNGGGAVNPTPLVNGLCR